jgi:hypothetical protein
VSGVLLLVAVLFYWLLRGTSAPEITALNARLDTLILLVRRIYAVIMLSSFM